jgi:hypothetical protein
MRINVSGEYARCWEEMVLYLISMGVVFYDLSGKAKGNNGIL